jgi:hypothetical protein
MVHCIVFPQGSLLTLCEKQAMAQSGWKHRFALIFFATIENRHIGEKVGGVWGYAP